MKKFLLLCSLVYQMSATHFCHDCRKKFNNNIELMKQNCCVYKVLSKDDKNKICILRPNAPDKYEESTFFEKKLDKVIDLLLKNFHKIKKNIYCALHKKTN